MRAPAVPSTGGEHPLIVDALIESLQKAGVGPPRQLWLPPLGVPPAADDLVARLRGKPWDVDYGDNPACCCRWRSRTARVSTARTCAA